MDSVDYKKELKHLYKPTNQTPQIVDVPTMMFLTIDGRGDPADADYQNAVKTLYPLAYEIRNIVKQEQELAFTVMPLETLWWSNQLESFNALNKANWLWKAMIMQPEVVTKDIVERAQEVVIRKKKDVPKLDLVRYESLLEGLSAQVLHIGAYKDEAPTIQGLHQFIESEGYDQFGRHHEIYLSDPNRVAAEKLKTIIRQPVKFKHSR